MRVIIAEDDMISQRVLSAMLSKWGFEVSTADDGEAAMKILNGENPPQLAILDWMMPGLDGVEVTRRIRAREGQRYTYIMLLTAKERVEDIISGLDAGADDYVIKPFNHKELRARLKVGVRVLELERRLAENVSQLEDALSRVKQLQGLLPICSYCKRIRDDKNYWMQVEAYIGQHSDAQFSHSICPDCYEKKIKPELEKHNL